MPIVHPKCFFSSLLGSTKKITQVLYQVVRNSWSYVTWKNTFPLFTLYGSSSGTNQRPACHSQKGHFFWLLFISLADIFFIPVKQTQTLKLTPAQIRPTSGPNVTEFAAMKSGIAGDCSSRRLPAPMCCLPQFSHCCLKLPWGSHTHRYLHTHTHTHTHTHLKFLTKSFPVNPIHKAAETNSY